MKPDVRRDLAPLPFEEKIRKVAELIRLSRELKAQRVCESIPELIGVGRVLCFW